jgi:hypothetical protein
VKPGGARKTPAATAVANTTRTGRNTKAILRRPEPGVN